MEAQSVADVLHDEAELENPLDALMLGWFC